MNKKINIIQHGIDGAGHQLHGLLSCLALHDVNNYYFDGISFMNKPFRFDHIFDEKSYNNIKNYLIEIVNNFLKYNNQIKKEYLQFIHAHEVYNIPNNYNENILYRLDNAYYFNKIPINECEKKIHLENINKCKDYFINDKLPENRLTENNIVIHLRQGDAMTTGRGNGINDYNKKLLILINIFTKKYKDYTYYIHTDGNCDFISNYLSKNNINFQLFFKEENLLNVLSDFIYSKIFISGISSLSFVCTFLGNHNLIIIPDNVKHSMPDSVIRITNYIEKYKLYLKE